jgi:tetratricopeptide (TPR) repeat protein
MAAYALVQEARRAADTLSEQALQEAQGLLEEAIFLDPDYFDAWYELSRVHNLTWGLIYDPQQQRAKLAEHALERALSLDRDNPLAREALANQLALRGAWVEAFSSIEKSLEMYPRDADLLDTHAVMLARIGDIDGALRQSGEAVALDPLNPMKLYLNGLYWHFAGEFERAVETIDRAVSLGAIGPWVLADLGLAHYYGGREEQARDLWVGVMRGAIPEEQLNFMLEEFDDGGFLGMVAASVAAARHSDDLCGNNPWGIAYTAALIDDEDVVFQCLEVAARRNRILHLMGHHQFHKYRSDPRFAEILAITGLDQVVDPRLLQ